MSKPEHQHAHDRDVSKHGFSFLRPKPVNFRPSICLDIHQRSGGLSRANFTSALTPEIPPNQRLSVVIAADPPKDRSPEA
jgi:hypothetical protein